jgi:hypothetical protein
LQGVRAQHLVRSYCAGQHIGYTETSLIGSYTAALRHLNELGAPLRGAGTGIPVLQVDPKVLANCPGSHRYEAPMRREASRRVRR